MRNANFDEPAKQAINIGSTGLYSMDEILSDEVVGVSYDKRPFFHSSALDESMSDDIAQRVPP